MRTAPTLLSLCLFVSITNAQLKKQTITASIEKVTVFLQGAQVNRSARVPVTPGKTDLVFSNISPAIDKQSIQVKAEGKITVLSVVHQLNHLKEQETREEIKNVDAQKLLLQEKMDAEKNMVMVYRQEEAMLLKNQDINGTQAVLKTTELKDAVDFQRQRLTEVYNKITECDRTIKKLQAELEKLNRQLAALNDRKDQSTSEIIVTILAKEAASAGFSLTYLVQKAGWYPGYDIRVKDISSPIEIQHKANIYQQSGEDWKDIKLFLSTGNPNDEGTKPTMAPWYLRYAAVVPSNLLAQRNVIEGANALDRVLGRVTDVNGTPIPNASIIIKGTNTGITTQGDGSFSLQLPKGGAALVVSAVGMNTTEISARSGYMNIRLPVSESQLSEVVVTGYSTQRSAFAEAEFEDRNIKRKKEEASITTTTFYQPTTTVYEIEEPYSVLNDGKLYTADINTYELKALYEYYAAPKIDPSAFLTARITDWQELNLLSGEASLFFEGTFLGKSSLDVASAGDTLNLSLGKDKGVIVKRTLLKEFSSRRFLGSNRTDSRQYEILVRNNKQVPINITVEDQFPISTSKEIEVDNKQAPDARIDDDSQRITWLLSVESRKETRTMMKYAVKYPKEKLLRLE